MQLHLQFAKQHNTASRYNKTNQADKQPKTTIMKNENISSPLEDLQQRTLAKRKMANKIKELKEQLEVARMLEDIYNEPYSADDYADDGENAFDPFVMQMLREPSMRRELSMKVPLKSRGKLDKILHKDHRSYDFDQSGAAVCYMDSTRSLVYNDDEGKEERCLSNKKQTIS